MIQPVSPGLFSANASGQGVAAALTTRVDAGGSQSTEAIFECGPSLCLPTPVDLGPESDQVFLLLFGTGIRGASSQLAV